MCNYFNRRHSYHGKVARSRNGARFYYLCRLQKVALRTLTDHDFRMSTSTFKQSSSEPESPAEGTQFSGHRNSKPDSNCRTCNDFKSWSKQQRLNISGTPATKDGTHTATNEKRTVQVAAPRDDCPLDKSRLGVFTWGLLHTMAAYYADNPTDTEKRDMRTFFDVLSRLYPCDYCAKDFRKDIAVNPVNVDSQKDLAQWLCKFHNRVNDKLGKPLFDCSKVNERWRDGWLDGSCD